MVEREPLLLILDAYDEFGGRDPLKLFATGSDVTKHPDIMVIVTCRPEYLSRSGERSLLPSNKLGNGDAAKLKQLFAVPFSKAKTQQYLEKFCGVTESALLPAWYVRQIRSLGLEPLLTGPFMFKIVATVLPSLVEPRAATGRVQRLDLMRGYVQLYVERKCTDDWNVLERCVVMAVEMFQSGQLAVAPRELAKPPWPELLGGSFGSAAPTRRNALGLAFVCTRHSALFSSSTLCPHPSARAAAPTACTISASRRPTGRYCCSWRIEPRANRRSRSTCSTPCRHPDRACVGPCHRAAAPAAAGAHRGYLFRRFRQQWQAACVL
jgi:hypothetical protein